MNIHEKLLSFGKKNIDLEELLKMLGLSSLDSEKCFEKIHTLQNQELIEPVKSSKTNGNNKYPLYNRYRILIKNEVSEETKSEINSLHPRLQSGGYLIRHFELYEKYRDEIQVLSRYLFQNSDTEYISRKERSYEIFSKEKVLDDKGMKNLLSILHISKDDLKFYDTPDYCFHDFIKERKDEMTLLICENKDIWFAIRRLMFEENISDILGTRLDGVVFGNGNKVAEKHGALTEYVRFMGNPKVHFLYWGDIDREGFDIYRRCLAANPDISIELFFNGYKLMLDLAEGKNLEDSPSERLNYADVSCLFANENNFQNIEGSQLSSCNTHDDAISKNEVTAKHNTNTILNDHEYSTLDSALKQNKLIPQEIVSYAILKSNCEQN